MMNAPCTDIFKLYHLSIKFQKRMAQPNELEIDAIADMFNRLVRVSLSINALNAPIWKAEMTLLHHKICDDIIITCHLIV